MDNLVNKFMTYKILFIPLIVVVIVQIFKSLYDLKKGHFNWNVFISYGGMPSGHTAMVVSAATTIGLYSGFNSPVFLLSLVLAILVIRDALGFRMQLSEHAKILNKLIKELPDEKEFNYPYSPERLGHTYAQVIVGGILGLALTYLFYFLI